MHRLKCKNQVFASAITRLQTQDSDDEEDFTLHPIDVQQQHPTTQRKQQHRKINNNIAS